MCGIAGFSGVFDQSLLKKMSDYIAHRGPDDAGQLFIRNKNNGVGLAHRRLSIIDLSAEGHQPMTVKCSRCDSTNQKNKLYLIYNGELYNYKQLKNELISKGHQFHSHTDSEVLLHLYSDYGVQMLTQLDGIFAFAIYDEKNNHLFLARDGLGVKPLYYAVLSQGFLFSSELKALLPCKDLSREIDHVAIHYYLAYLWCPGQRTALKQIKKLEPGEAMIVKEKEIIKRWFFYDLPYNNDNCTVDPEQISTALIQYLEQAVQKQLMSDVPLGAFLSGGLDSSAIVAMMRHLNPTQKIECYTIACDEGMTSEGHVNDLPYAQEVAKHLNVNLNVLNIKSDMINHLDEMIYYLDEPQADPAPIHVYLIAKAAKSDGIKVLLSGTGGDDIFTGYRRHRAMQLEKTWNWFPHLMKKYIAKAANHSLNGKINLSYLHHPSIRRIAKVFSNVDLPLNERIASHFMWSTDHLRKKLYSQELFEKTKDVVTAAPMLESLKRIPHENDRIHRMLYLEAKHFLADHNLNYTDKMSMAAGVEVRVPLLDSELISFVSRIPSNLKQKGNIGKFIFKKSMHAFLPKQVIYRSKTGFGAPMRKWLRHELKPLVGDVLSESAINKRGLFSAKEINRLVEMNDKGRVDAAYTIFSLICIELWCRHFVDKKT